MLPKGQKNKSRLAIFYKQSRTKNIRNKFYSKAQCFRAIFTKTSFYNVNFKGAILTNCSFKKSNFSHVEFLGTNLKKSNFSGSKFYNCIFSGALLKKANFKDCTFENCLFINVNLKTSKNFNIGESSKILKNFPSPASSENILCLLNEFRFNPKIHNSRVLHLKGGKLNLLTLMLLIEKVGSSDALEEKLKILNGNLPSRIITTHDLCNVIDNAY